MQQTSNSTTSQKNAHYGKRRSDRRWVSVNEPVLLVERSLSQLHTCLIWLAVKAIRLYQLTLSPWLGNQCRFYPTCSRYAQQALREHGLWRGTILSVKRLSRCHPYHAGGVDLVPDVQPGHKHS